MVTRSTENSSQFQSTHSLRSATPSGTLELYGFIVSIHALLAECDNDPGKAERLKKVSIHALLAECDPLVWGIVTQEEPVSIHALLAECDPFHAGI